MNGFLYVTMVHYRKEWNIAVNALAHCKEWLTRSSDKDGFYKRGVDFYTKEAARLLELYRQSGRMWKATLK